MITGRNASTGPGLPRPRSFAPQPHWKKMTSTPNDAPAASRFMTAAVAGTSRQRKATSSSRNPSPTITVMKSGIFELMMLAKSSKIAVLPPT